MRLPALTRLHSRFGLLRVNLILGVVGVAVLAVVLNHAFGPMLVSRLGLAWVPLIYDGLIVLVAMIGIATLHVGVVRPLESHRVRLRERLSEAGTENEVQVLSYWAERRATQLKAALEDNERLRGELASHTGTASRHGGMLDALVRFSTDSLMVVDADGMVRSATGACLQLVALRDYQLVGRVFDEVVELFDASKDHPLEYRVTQWVANLIANASTIPAVSVFILRTGSGRDVEVIATASAVLSEGKPIGALVRLESASGLDVQSERIGISRKDPLTDLLNRQVFESRFDELVDIARQQKAEHQFIFIAVDGLHEIIAQFGHWAGEETLWNIARTITREVGSVGDGYRVSTDRFGVLLAFTETDAADKLAERIRIAVDAQEFEWQGTPFSVTVSLAVVGIRADGEGRRGLLTIANDVVADLQVSGGNARRVHAPSESLSQRRRNDAEWSQWLFAHLDDGRGHLISQSIEPLDKTADLAPWVEVLLRVEDDDGVWIAPGAYLPAIDRRNETTRVDLWVLGQAIAAYQAAGESMADVAGLTINLFGSSLTTADFGDQVIRLIDASDIDPACICFELDERFASSHLSEVRSFIETVRPSGVKFALDRCKATVGLGALRSLSLDIIKIQDALVRRMLVDDIDRAHLEWIYEAGHKMGLHVVATGVEQDGQIAALKSIGVDYAQGVAINKIGPLIT